MKRPYVLAVSLVALVVSAATSACHRNDCPSTTSTTSGTVNASDPAAQTPRLAPNSNATSASPAAPPPAPGTPRAITPADLPNATGTGATGAAGGSTARAAAPPSPRATSTGPLDITGPSPAAPTDGSGAGGGSSSPGGGGGDPGNAASTTTTTGAPLVAPGLDNGVTGGVSNIGSPLNNGGSTGYSGFIPAPTSTMLQPVGGAMRPGAASDPNTTSGR